MRGAAQPRARARGASWYWRAVLAVLAQTCLRVAWRTSTRAGRVTWVLRSWGGVRRVGRSYLLWRTLGRGLDKVARPLGHPGDGLLPEVSLELTPDLSLGWLRGHTRARYGHANPSTSPRGIRTSLGAGYEGRHVRVEVCGV